MEKASNTILLVCVTRKLAEAQRTLLEEHGHRVLVAGDLRELGRISRDTYLTCAILGEDIGDSMKHAIATQLSERFAAIPILEEYTVSPVLPDAEHILAEQPADLLTAIDDLLLPYGRRYTAYLQKKALILRERVREARERAKYVTGQSRQTRSYVKRKSRKNNEKHRP